VVLEAIDADSHSIDSYFEILITGMLKAIDANSQSIGSFFEKKHE
jgi:hypothetical protein